MKTTFFDFNKAKDQISSSVLESLLKQISLIDVAFQLNAAREIRDLIKKELSTLGWSTNINIHPGLKISITAINQNVGLCLQLGNMSRFYADLLKLEALYKNKSIHSAIYILPTKHSSRKLGSNLVNFERFSTELNEVFSKTITIPIYIIGLGESDDD